MNKINSHTRCCALTHRHTADGYTEITPDSESYSQRQTVTNPPGILLKRRTLTGEAEAEQCAVIDDRQGPQGTCLEPGGGLTRTPGAAVG